MKALRRAREELEKRQGGLREMRRRFFVYSAIVFTGFVQAAGTPVEEAKHQARVVDAQSGAGIVPAWVAANEAYRWTAFGLGHSASGTVCFRRAVASTDGAYGTASLVLPRTNVVDPRFSSRDGREIEFVAYRSGYCVGRSSLYSPKPGEELALRMTPVTNDPSEHRLRHLKIAAQEFAHSCFALGSALLDPVKTAVLAEASRIAVTPLEKFLVTQIEQQFDPFDAPKKTLFLPFQGLASSGDVKMLRMLLDQRRIDPTLRLPFTTSRGVNGSSIDRQLSPGGPNHISLNPTLDINDRNEEGFTPLMEGARAMQPATVKMLIEEGADVNVVSSPGGYSALDLVLSRASDDVRESGTEGQEIHLLRLLDLLATARPAPTIHPSYRAELADTGLWTLKPHLREFWLQVRQRVTGLRARDVVTTTCPIARAARLSLGLRG